MGGLASCPTHVKRFDCGLSTNSYTTNHLTALSSSPHLPIPPSPHPSSPEPRQGRPERINHGRDNIAHLPSNARQRDGEDQKAEDRSNGKAEDEDLNLWDAVAEVSHRDSNQRHHGEYRGCGLNPEDKRLMDHVAEEFDGPTSRKRPPPVPVVRVPGAA